MSETKNLAAALAKAQAQIKHAEKDRTNPHFKNKYATLASLWDAIREPFTKNGLSLSQEPCARLVGEDWCAGCVTILAHESGEERRSELLLPLDRDASAQVCGSAITYARRYALAGIAGVCADEDDDGAAASDRKPSPRQSQQRDERVSSKPAAGQRGSDEYEAAIDDRNDAWAKHRAQHATLGLDAPVWAETFKRIYNQMGFNEWPDPDNADMIRAAANKIRELTEALRDPVGGPPPGEGPDANGKPRSHKEART